MREREEREIVCVCVYFIEMGEGRERAKDYCVHQRLWREWGRKCVCTLITGRWEGGERERKNNRVEGGKGVCVY